MVDIRGMIARKRDGAELRPEEIAELVNAYTDGRVSDAAMAALLMAVVLRGMTARETALLTKAMMESGDRLDLSAIPGTKVDKHSTGGVGDKTTLVVAPLVASFGVKVPKMSGRALGHTGGTIDKLECIPGLTTELPPERFRTQLSEIGVAIAAQSLDLCPADKKIYALRDATATVASMPLIASSVMSKKLAAGADAIVLDVKVGRGAFVEQEAEARQLAEAMVEIGASMGKRMVALITRMDQPLGRAVGDAVEMVEAMQTLQGNGPPDFVELCEVVAAHMLVLGDAVDSAEQGRRKAREAMQDGRGLAKMRELLAAQGGDASVTETPDELLAGAVRIEVTSEEDGYVADIDARKVGEAVRELKGVAGEDTALCGVVLHRKVGGKIRRGDSIATVFAPEQSLSGAKRTALSISGAVRQGRSAQAPPPPLLLDLVEP